MAKKPKVTITEDMTDDEVAAAKAENAEAESAASAPTSDEDAAKPAEPFFVTSMSQGSLLEANRLAREQRAKEELAISDGYRAAIVAVNRAFSPLTPVLSVEDAVRLGTQQA